MQILKCMRSQTHRSKINSILILNIFSLQFISLISLNRLNQFYYKIAEVLLMVDGQIGTSQILIYINFGFNMLLVLMYIIIMLFKKFKYRKFIIGCLSVIILNFKYVFLIPVGCVNVRQLTSTTIDIKLKIFCSINMAITFVLSATQLFTNWSSRFVQKDYCNRRLNSIICLLFQFGFVFSTLIFGNLVGSLFLIAVSLFRAYQVSITVQYPLIQKSTFFYSSLNIYLCIICFIGEGKFKFLQFTLQLIIGIMVSLYFARNVCNFINTWSSNNKNLYKLANIKQNSFTINQANNDNNPNNWGNKDARVTNISNVSEKDKETGHPNKSMIKQTGDKIQRFQKEQSQLQSDNKKLISDTDIIVLSRILLSKASVSLNKKISDNSHNDNNNHHYQLSNREITRQKLQKSKELNQQWNIWWQKYDLLIVSHILGCLDEKCYCKQCPLLKVNNTLKKRPTVVQKKIKNQQEQTSIRSNNSGLYEQFDQSQIIKLDMHKLMTKLEEKQKTSDIRIMGIYLNLQIIKKPLKSYYQIIKMNKQQISVTNSIDLQCLRLETRDEFNRIFIQKKIQNNKLPLLKITKFQQLVQELQAQIKNTIELCINFNELFSLNSIKISQILNDSNKIQAHKQKINNRLEDIVINYPDSVYVNFLICIFYQYFQIYRSKQKQLKSISQEKNLKRRLFEKQEHNIFSLQYGVIFIDLTQQRGKIKKITKNLCQVFGYNFQDMIDFNISQFMPRLFSKNHNKFLSNFIEHGKVKIIGSKKRLLMAKNKNKFIFMVQARLKIQYLTNTQFGATALVKKSETSSQFIMFNVNGRVQQITQKLYKLLFSNLLKAQVDKIRRLCLLKMIPNLVTLINQGLIQQNPKQVYQSLLIFSTFPQMLQKFKLYRQNKNGFASTYNSNSNSASYYSNSLEIQQTTNQICYGTNGLGATYYGDLFKYFLADLNIIKLNAFSISYKISRIKTQQFSVLLLQVLSVESVEESFSSLITEYKKITQYLNVYEQHGSVVQNLHKFQQIIQKNDVMDYMFNKNVIRQSEVIKLNYNEALQKQKKRLKSKKSKKKILTICEDQNDDACKNQTKSIQTNSIINNFQGMSHGLNNKEMQRGGSQRSSITDQSQNHSKTQMLINAFNNKNNSLNIMFLVFVNILVFTLFIVLIVMIQRYILTIQLMQSKQLKQIMNLKLKQKFQFRMATEHIQIFYKILSSQSNTQVNISNIPFLTSQIIKTKQKVNQQFTQTLLFLNQINKIVPYQENSYYLQNVTVLDTIFGRNKQITFLQMINDLDYKFKYENIIELPAHFQLYLQKNYEMIHTKLQQFVEKSSFNNQSSNTPDSIQYILILILAMYQFICLTIAISWIPVLYFISKQQKKIIALLSKMNIRQLKRTTHKFRFILENLKVTKNIVSQINYVLSMLHDDKMLEGVDHFGNEKNMMRSVRLVQQSGCYSIKPKHVSFAVIVFILFFSLLPLILYMNLNADSQKFQKKLNVIRQTYFLADKAPILANIYLTNINKKYRSEQVKSFSTTIYQQAQTQYFDLNAYIAGVQQLVDDLIQTKGQNYNFTGNICEQISYKCTDQQKQNDVKFYDQITLFRNTFAMLNPSKLNIEDKNTDIGQIQQWIKQNNVLDLLNWINKIYEFVQVWNKKFQIIIYDIFKQTEKRFYMFGAIFIPFYLVVMIYLQYWIIRKINQIIKNAESIHMHFPVQLLVENTYLISYFNDKIKNNK